MEPCLYTSVTSEDRPMLARHHPEAIATRRPLEASLAADHPETRVLSVMVHDDVTWDVLERFPRLEAVVTRSAGFDHLPLEALAAHGVAAYHLAGYATRSVAELAVLHILAGLRRVPEAVARTRGGSWERGGLAGRRLDECTIGLLGTGRIGAEVARLLSAWGARVRCFDLRPDDDVAALPGVAYVPDQATLLAGADALSLHLPLDEGTQGIIDAEAIAAMPDGAVLVNTSRGGLVDEPAVLAALEDGRLGGYLADVMQGEPRPPGLPAAATRPEVLLTPHLGAHVGATLEHRFATTARISKAVLTGNPGDVAAYRVDAAS